GRCRGARMSDDVRSFVTIIGALRGRARRLGAPLEGARCAEPGLSARVHRSQALFRLPLTGEPRYHTRACERVRPGARVPRVGRGQPRRRRRERPRGGPGRRHTAPPGGEGECLRGRSRRRFPGPRGGRSVGVLRRDDRRGGRAAGGGDRAPGAGVHAGSAETQLERFQTAVGRLARRPPLLHAANSAAALRGKAFALDAIRPGISLYGASVGAGPPIGKPVIALRARVVSVRKVRRGESVSYNASWTAPRDTTVATLAIGYADGVRRSLGLKGEATVLLNGARCPVVGLVTMDLTMVDVRDARAAVGDVATLVGEADGLGNTLDQFAAWSGTLQHELLAGLGPRLPRIYD